MAIAKTGAMFKTLTFDGQSSRNYGVYITGEAVYNAPDRAVEMITIPGRNGAFARDDGRFENIEVTYPAGVFAENETDFAEAISDFRNMLCSRKGYCRLTDDYNPDEYREAVYKSGLEVTPALLRAGEFEITFECKPQRFLTSGETAVSVANNGTITNPTLFDAKPQLQVKGYGTININSDEIKVSVVPLGEVTIAAYPGGGTSSNPYTQTLFNTNNVNNGDTITTAEMPYCTLTCVTASSVTVTSSTNASTITSGHEIKLAPNAFNFTYNTSATYTASCNFSYVISGTTYTGTASFAIKNNGSNFTYTVTETHTGSRPITVRNFCFVLKADSTKNITGDPLYIDLDIGEAWNEDYGTPVPVNNAVSLPAKLPVLPPGSTTITYDNTITSFKIVPRWWQV